MSGSSFFRLYPGLQNPIHATVFAVILLLTKAVATILDDIGASAYSTTAGDRFLYPATILSSVTIRPLPLTIIFDHYLRPSPMFSFPTLNYYVTIILATELSSHRWHLFRVASLVYVPAGCKTRGAIPFLFTKQKTIFLFITVW